MFEEPTLPPHLLPLYTVFYLASDDEPSNADSTEIWEVGLEEGYPIAICFSDEDANTVADALNSARLAPIADADLVASFGVPMARALLRVRCWAKFAGVT